MGPRTNMTQCLEGSPIATKAQSVNCEDQNPMHVDDGNGGMEKWNKKTTICESRHGLANGGMGVGEMEWNENKRVANNAKLLDPRKL